MKQLDRRVAALEDKKAKFLYPGGNSKCKIIQEGDPTDDPDTFYIEIRPCGRDEDETSRRTKGNVK